MNPHCVCRMLQPGQSVKVVNLTPWLDGQVGTVVSLCPGQDANQPIMPTGIWTVAFPDPPNGGVLHREVQRLHLRLHRPKKC